ncbi:hypothetical protein HanPSC8_Chr02g0073101 [Helianthus annuus]|nr:hypothetical protein HanPSC8_Chr02g0073101 [Helianthus annuus]
MWKREREVVMCLHTAAELAQKFRGIPFFYFLDQGYPLYDGNEVVGYFYTTKTELRDIFILRRRG